MIIDTITILQDEEKSVKYDLYDIDGHAIDLTGASLSVDTTCLRDADNLNVSIYGLDDGFSLLLSVKSGAVFNIPCWLTIKQDGTKVLARVCVFAIKKADLR